MADAFSGPLDGYALWLATEGRPKSPATIRNYCLYLRQLRSYALQRGLTSWEQLTRSHIRAFLAQRREETSAATAHLAFSACKSFFRYLLRLSSRGPQARRPRLREEPYARIPGAPLIP